MILHPQSFIAILVSCSMPSMLYVLSPPVFYICVFFSASHLDVSWNRDVPLPVINVIISLCCHPPKICEELRIPLYGAKGT